MTGFICWLADDWLDEQGIGGLNEWLSGRMSKSRIAVWMDE